MDIKPRYKYIDPSEEFLNGRVRFEVYKGKKILVTDYSNLGPEETCQLAKDIIIWNNNYKHDPDSIINYADFANSHINKEGFETLQKMGNEILKPYNHKIAVVGITKLQFIFLNAINKITGGNTRAFDSKEEAFDWLVE